MDTREVLRSFGAPIRDRAAPVHFAGRRDELDHILVNARHPPLAARFPAGLYASVRLLRLRWFRNLPLAFGNMSNKPVPEPLFSSWIEPALGDPAVRRDLAKYLRRVPSKKQLLRWADEQRAFRGAVLVVWARDDRLMPPAHARRLATHFENTRLVWIDDSRTLIPVDQPDVLARHLRDFLGAA